MRADTPSVRRCVEHDEESTHAPGPPPEPIEDDLRRQTVLHVDATDRIVDRGQLGLDLNDERDACLWARELGRQARIVHLHQTETNHSRHWPFTPEYNAIGIIEPPSILRSLVEGGAEDIFLAFEIAHREAAEQDDRVVAELKASAAYWRQFVPQDGLWSPPPAAQG